jgi:hypothetical protein
MQKISIGNSVRNKLRRSNLSESFGPDYYSFRAGDIAGMVLNSNLEKGTEQVPAEAAKMETWFRNELELEMVTSGPVGMPLDGGKSASA